MRLCVHHSDVRVVLASNFGLSILTKSDAFLIDGTFCTTECDLVLMVLIGLWEGIAIPCVYLLSNSRETHTYKSFFKVR
jgi:hypothetical protein